jgi:hypothetical protein
MSEVYLSLSLKEQAQILRSLSTNPSIKRDAILLEKDIWICWALEMLFKMPNRLPMAFKGGTSLSKAFRVIDRFSEDIDITVDYKAFNCEDPFAEGVSKTKIKNISLQLRSTLTQHINRKIIPYFEKIISEHFKENFPTIELDNDGETLHLYYPSAIEQRSGYVTDSVRLEFGGRNITVPSNIQTISTDVSEYLNHLSFPNAEVTVLSPQKTFWEKITLIHYECNRPNLKEDADRISRHWYDISMLANHEIGKQALANHKLLNEVIKIKKTFYDSGFAKYDDCVNGNICLIPSDDYLKLLKDDFNKMIVNKMFYSEPPSFEKVILSVRQVQDQINRGEAY